MDIKEHIDRFVKDKKDEYNNVYSTVEYRLQELSIEDNGVLSDVLKFTFENWYEEVFDKKIRLTYNEYNDLVDSVVGRGFNGVG